MVKGKIWVLVVFTVHFTALAASAKTGRTYFTDARVAIARQNVEKFDWAQKARDNILASANHWAGYSDERLRTLVPPPTIPRAIIVNGGECPVHGLEARKNGLYTWKIDFDHPWKVRCPAGGEEYPSNDFAKFLATGMKDRSLLTGDHPDDGWGWRKPGEEKKYWFVGYYCHWSVKSFLLPAIRDLGQAAVLTGDPKYAHKCALLLWQLAQYYPDYQYEKQSRYGTEFDPAYFGKLMYHTWECWTVDVCGPAYDAVFPFLKDDKELQALTGETADQIDADLRDRLLLVMALCITDGSHRIQGNYGMHQQGLIRLAAALDEMVKSPTSAEMIDWVLNNQNVGIYTDLGLQDALINVVLRDGVPFESPGYNYHWVATLTEIAQALQDVHVDYFKDSRFGKLLTWPFAMCVAGQFTPAVGDSGNMFAVGGMWDAGALSKAIRYVHDPRMAQVLRSTKNLPHDLFEEPIEEVLADFPESAAQPIGVESMHLPGYGLANLQSGSDENRTAASLFYGYHVGHAHFDKLNLSFFSHGNALLTDFGYPETADGFDPRRYGFFSNTLAHNTLVVDGSRQKLECRGKPYAYDASTFTRVVDASCEGAYPGKVSLYRRVNMLVEVTPTQSYLFDAFYVRGGKQHDYIVHGTQADFSCEPALGPVQQKGTLAGPEVPYGQFYDDPNLKDKPTGTVSYYPYQGSGYQFLFNAQRGPLKDAATALWRLTEPGPKVQQHPWEGIGLRAHLLGSDEELISCDGRPQRTHRVPETVKFLVRRRTGGNLQSRFVTVFEPFKGSPWIKRVSSVTITPDDGNAAAALVELVGGGRHYIFHSLDPGKTYTLDGKVRVSGQAACLALGDNEQVEKAMLLNGSLLSLDSFSLLGSGLRKSRIKSVDYRKGIIEVADPVVSPGLKPGQTIVVAPNSFADCVTLQKVIDPMHFSIGDEDLRVAGGRVARVEPEKKQIISSVISYFSRPGMSVLNSRMQPQGRLTDGPQWTLDRTGLPPLKSEDFPNDPDGSPARFTVVMAGPGDEVWIPDVVELGGKPTR